MGSKVQGSRLLNRIIFHKIPDSRGACARAKSAAYAPCFIHDIFKIILFSFLSANRAFRTYSNTNSAVPASSAGRTLRSAMVKIVKRRHTRIEIFWKKIFRIKILKRHPAAINHPAGLGQWALSINNIYDRICRLPAGSYCIC